jgi:hypothetical protein
VALCIRRPRVGPAGTKKCQLRSILERALVESAITDLDELLLSDSNDESVFQAWFERHPVVFVILGFSQFIPHPRLLLSSGKELIPDFFAQRANASWEVFEIKTPQTQVLRDLERRTTFYATFEQYVSQCHEYSESFDEKSTQTAVEAAYGAHIQKRPRSIIVAGRNEGIDLDKLFAMCSRREPPVAVYTYDDVLRALEDYRTFHFGAYDKAQGFGFCGIFALHRPTRQSANHIFDVGVYPDRDRIAISVSADHFLKLTVWDSAGRVHEAQSVNPLDVNDYDVPSLFLFEAGVGDGFGFLSIQLDGKYHAEVRTSSFALNLSHEYVLGSDWSGKASSWFSAFEIVVRTVPLSFELKLAFRHYAIERYGEIRSGIESKRLLFVENKFMYTKGHPVAFGRDGKDNNAHVNTHYGDLEQGIPRHQPDIPSSS